MLTVLVRIWQWWHRERLDVYLVVVSAFVSVPPLRAAWLAPRCEAAASQATEPRHAMAYA